MNSTAASINFFALLRYVDLCSGEALGMRGPASMPEPSNSFRVEGLGGGEFAVYVRL
jgi:hypothetical protein